MLVLFAFFVQKYYNLYDLSFLPLPASFDPGYVFESM